MPKVHSFKVSCSHASAFPALQPGGLYPGGCIQWWLPGPGCSPRCSSPWPTLLPIYPGAPLHSTFDLLWKLQLGQRFCVLFMFISFVRLIYVVLYPSFFHGSEAACSSCSINIRFSSDQHVVSPIHSGRQPSQACLVSATDDGWSGSCLLEPPWPCGLLHGYAFYDVFIFPFQSKSYDEMIFSSSILHGVGATQDIPAFSK